MRSNIDETVSRIESLESTDQVTIDGDTSEVILRAMVEDGMDEFQSAVDRMPSVDIRTVTATPFGLEVELW